ncbi:MAG: ribbon-helix-helix domain-containing protein [Thaumarchaeota archaeon]|nr:ribbon-helix-helix domain-containing protein [Nitrososphaerota archaeon]
MPKKLNTSVSLDVEMLKLIDVAIKKKKFASRSHAIEYALQKLKDEGEI